MRSGHPCPHPPPVGMTDGKSVGRTPARWGDMGVRVLAVAGGMLASAGDDAEAKVCPVRSVGAGTSVWTSGQLQQSPV